MIKHTLIIPKWNGLKLMPHGLFASEYEAKEYATKKKISNYEMTVVDYEPVFVAIKYDAGDFFVYNGHFRSEPEASKHINEGGSVYSLRTAGQNQTEMPTE